MGIQVDTVALAGTGARLRSAVAAVTARTVSAPAQDPTSLAGAAILTAHATNTTLAVAHSDLQRIVGGDTVTYTGAAFADGDQDIAGLFGWPGTPGDPVAPQLGAVPGPADMVPIPAMPAAPAVPGEVFARQLHGGVGSAVLRQAATQFASDAATLIRVADETSSAANSIDTQWHDDGHQQAGANTSANADWLRQTAARFRQLGTAATTLADDHDTALAATPTDVQFDQAHLSLRQAAAAGDLPSYVTAQQHMVSLQSQATEAGGAYFASFTQTTAALSTGIGGSPDIALYNAGDLPLSPFDVDPKTMDEAAARAAYAAMPGEWASYRARCLARPFIVPTESAQLAACNSERSFLAQKQVALEVRLRELGVEIVTPGTEVVPGTGPNLSGTAVRIGEEVATVPPGTRADTLAERMTGLGLNQAQATEATNIAAARVWGQTSGVVNLPDGSRLVLPTMLEFRTAMQIWPNGTVTVYRGDLSQFR